MTSNDDREPGVPADVAVSQAELQRVDALLGLPAAWVEPDHELEERVLTAWRQASRPASRGVDGALAAVGPLWAMPARPAPARRWRARVSGALVGAAAASLLFVAVSLIRRPAPPNLRLTFAATQLAPQASGSARLTETTSGWRIEINTRGLVRLDKGRYYEAWLEGPKGIVSIGTFHTGAKVTLWAGVEADEYTSLTVTVEDEDGNPASSLQRVLTAPVAP